MNDVDGLSNRAELAMIEAKLLKHGGQIYADIWQLGLNTALRITDLLSLRMQDVQGQENLTLLEGKTGKTRQIKLNARALEVINRRVANHPRHTWLFQSDAARARSAQKPINRSTVARKFQEIGEIVGVNLGTHSMRKSRGAVMYVEGVPLETISKVLNHSHPAVTMRYIGLTKKAVAETYDDFVL
jgi:integrase